VYARKGRGTMMFFILCVVLYVLGIILVFSFDYLSGDSKIYSIVENVVFPLLVGIFWPIVAVILFVTMIIRGISKRIFEIKSIK
jgi:hypothetical protein